MPIPPSGSIFSIDSAGILYEFVWETINGVLDFTTTTRSPRVWGEPESGFIQDGVVYRRGIVTVQRQLIQQGPDGPTIIADGAVQYVDTFPITFPCGTQPQDPFLYHLNSSVVDEVDFVVTQGPRWTDPSNTADNGVVWPQELSGGTIPSPSSGVTDFAWVDVW